MHRSVIPIVVHFAMSHFVASLAGSPHQTNQRAGPVESGVAAIFLEHRPSYFCSTVHTSTSSYSENSVQFSFLAAPLLFLAEVAPPNF